MKIFGMPVGMIYEAVETHYAMIFFLFHLLNRKEKIRWYHTFHLIALSLFDIAILYTKCNPQLYSAYVQYTVKWFVFLMHLLNCVSVFKDNIWKVMGALFISDMLCGLPGLFRYFLYYITGFPPYDPETEIIRVGYEVLYLVIVAVEYILVRKLLRLYKERIKDGSKTMLKLLIAVYMTQIILPVYTPLLFLNQDAPFMFVSNLLGITLIAVEIILFAFMYKSRRIQRENHYLAMQTSLLTEHNQVLNEQREMVGSLADWLEETKLSLPAGQLIMEQREQMKEADYCNNGIVNLAIQNKLRQCEERNIKTKIRMKQMALPKKLSEVDVLTIFYNLFDNAMEAAAACNGTHRYISVKAETKADSMILTMENGLPEQQMEKGKDRGQGLEIVKSIVDKYHGRFHIETAQDNYSIEIKV